MILLGPSATLLSADVPFLYDGCTLRVPAQIAGKPAYLIFDTGSSVSALDKKGFLSQLGSPIAEVRSSSIVGLANLNLYRSPEILVGDVALAADRVAAVDLSTVKAISGSECDGILGADFDRGRVVSINFDDRVLKISDTPDVGQGSPAVCLPLKSIGNGNVAVDAMVDGVPVTFMIDTGDNGSISLNQEDWARIVASRGDVETHTLLATPISGAPVETSGARIADLTIGPNHYKGFVATALQNSRGLSSLGLRFLRQHVVDFDFQRQKLFLRRGAAYGEREAFDMSGLHLVRLQGATVVYAVDSGSPAESAGIKPGDTIEQVNEVSADKLSLRDIRRVLKSNDGVTVLLKVRRGKEIAEDRLRLRKIL